MSGNLVARSVHDLSAAAWFGGSLMGAVGLNGATAQAKDPTERTRLSSLGWKRWAPVQTAAFAAHLGTWAPILWENKGRYAAQQGVMRWTWVKAGVTVAGRAARGVRQLDRCIARGRGGWRSRPHVAGARW